MTAKLSWAERAPKFALIRAQLRKIIANSSKPLDVAEIATEFKLQYLYLPNIERRLRELVDSRDVRKSSEKIPTYEMVS